MYDNTLWMNDTKSIIVKRRNSLNVMMLQVSPFNKTTTAENTVKHGVEQSQEKFVKEDFVG